MTHTTATCPELEALERELALYAESTHRNILKQLSKYAEQAEAEQADTLDNMHKELKKQAFESVWDELEARAEEIEEYAKTAEIIKALNRTYEILAKNAEIMKQIKKKRITVKATAKSRKPERKTISVIAKAKHSEPPAQPAETQAPEHITENHVFMAQVKQIFRKFQKIAASVTF